MFVFTTRQAASAIGWPRGDEIMHVREAARQTVGRAVAAARSLVRGPGIEAAESHRWGGEPIPSGMSRYHSRGGLEVVPGGYGAARGGSRLVEHNQKETPSEFAPVRVPWAHLLWAAAASLLEVIADDALGDSNASALAWERDLGLAKPDRVLSPALIRMALGLLERQARHRPAEAALISAVADPLGEVSARAIGLLAGSSRRP